MKPMQLFDPESFTYTYLLIDPVSRDAVLIDPVDSQIERDLAAIKAHGARLVWVIETHVHADHITSAAQLVEHTGAKVAVPFACDVATAAATTLNHGDTLAFGAERIKALHTPGHTAGSMSYVWRDHVFTGDTLLINGCGRTDFQGGSAKLLFHSITQVLFQLPPTTQVWPGHDYNGKTSSTIGQERVHNPRIANKTEDEFVAAMGALNLPKPKRIDSAVPANRWLGNRHDADAMADGVVRETPGYAGDVSPATAYAWWDSGDALLVDIRTDAERQWVGYVPDAAVVAWTQWPGMLPNPDYDREILALATTLPGKPLVMLCRSGVRSIASAKRATELGLVAYNITEGFEGDPNEAGWRAAQGGWKFRGLPWRQY